MKKHRQRINAAMKIEAAKIMKMKNVCENAHGVAKNVISGGGA
jgi:hypothetical protein